MSKANGWGRAGDPEKAKARAHAWRAQNPEKLKFVMRANAINMRRSSKGRVTYADLMAIRAGQGGRCRYCRCDLDEAVEYCDHIKPIKLGGSNWPWNIQYLCFDCSKRKGWKHPIDFETEEGFFGGGWVGLFKPVEYKKSSMICEMVK